MQELLRGRGLEQLLAFIAIAKAGSFTEAAKHLDRDASVVSRRLSELEARLGVRLVSRTTRHLSLTEIGAHFHRQVTFLLEELSKAGREASEWAIKPQGLLRISLSLAFGRQWVVPLLPGFTAKYPKIRIDARFSDRMVDVVADGFDVAVRVGVLSNSSLTSHKLASFRNVMVASPSYLAERGEPSSPSDLLTHSCLGFTGYTDWPDWQLIADGKPEIVRPSWSYIADSSEALFAIAIEGAGITCIPDWLAAPAINDGKLVEVLTGWEQRERGGIFAILPPGRMIPTKTRLFVDEIGQSIKARWPRSSKASGQSRRARI
jgi:DNA-binding transcriptional LysR family regulator